MCLLARRASSRTKRGGMPQLARWPLPMRAAAEPGLAVKPVGEAGKADAQASATTMVEVVTSNRVIRSRYTPGSNTSRPHGSDSGHNSRSHGSSSSSSSGDIRSHNSGDRGISSSTPGPAGRDHLPNNSTGAEHPTSGDNNIGEEISRTAAAHVSAVRRGGAFPREVQSNYARTSAAASSVCGIIFRSSCRAVRQLPSSSVGIARQLWTFDRVKLRASAATSQLCTCPADDTTAQT